MTAITLNLVQGTPEWCAFRATSFGASEAPAMMGKSKYQTRPDLLKQKHSGITPEIDAAMQRRFDAGHEAEVGGRKMAEAIIGEPLSPVVLSEDINGLKVSASLDGINFDGDILFEHKLFNADLAASIRTGTLPEMYTIQMDQQLLIADAAKCLFMCSDGTEENCAWMWYETTNKKTDAVVAGWRQFGYDLAHYTPPEVEVKPQAEAIKALPAVFVQATGMVTASNLAEFKEAATTFIAAIKTELVSDDDFANAEATVKFCKEAEGNLEATKASVLAQMSTVDEVVRTIDHISAQLRDKRLMLDKLVKSEKDARKEAIVLKARADFNDHYIALEAEINPIRLNFLNPDFPGAMKGLKKLSAMQEAVDTALRDGKYAAEQVAKDVRAKLAWIKTAYVGYELLFHDLQSLVGKPMDDMQLAVTSRIEGQKRAEEAKLEAQRASMQAEEERKATAKAQAEAEAILAAERAKQAAEDAKEREAAAIEERRKAAQLAEAAKDQRGKTPVRESEPAIIQGQDQVADRQNTTPSKRFRPTRRQMIESVANSWDVHPSEAEIWLRDEFCSENRMAA